MRRHDRQAPGAGALVRLPGRGLPAAHLRRATGAARRPLRAADPRLCDALQQIGLALVGAAGARLATVPGLQAGQTTLLGLIRRMFPQDHAVIACLAGRQEQGSQN